MKRSKVVTFTLAVPLLLSVSSCAGFSDNMRGFFSRSKEGPSQVDDLLARIEAVQVQCETADKASREAVASLHALVSPEFQGDPLSAYQELLDAIDNSRKQAKQLQDAVQPMKRSAGPFFAQWEADLSAFSNPDMRQRSQARLERTRARYEAIVRSVDPAMVTFDTFNANLRDHALYLENDFNSNSVASLRGSVRIATEQAAQLDAYLTATMNASEQYVQKAALRGQMEMTRTPAESDAPEPKR